MEDFIYEEQFKLIKSIRDIIRVKGGTLQDINKLLVKFDENIQKESM